MAAGTRKLRLVHFEIPNTTPVACVVRWSLDIEGGDAQDYPTRMGLLAVPLGPWATAQDLTLLQVRAQVLAALDASADVPPHDTVG